LNYLIKKSYLNPSLVARWYEYFVLVAKNNSKHTNSVWFKSWPPIGFGSSRGRLNTWRIVLRTLTKFVSVWTSSLKTLWRGLMDFKSVTWRPIDDVDETVFMEFEAETAGGGGRTSPPWLPSIWKAGTWSSKFEQLFFLKKCFEF
jgi:hypothetical protein